MANVKASAQRPTERPNLIFPLLPLVSCLVRSILLQFVEFFPPPLLSTLVDGKAQLCGHHILLLLFAILTVRSKDTDCRDRLG